MKRLIVFMLCLLVAGVSQAGLLTWTGGGDGQSTFQEANWDLDGGVAPAGSIDPDTAVLHDILYDGGGLGNPGGLNGASGLVIGDSQTLTVTAGTFRQAAYLGDGIEGVVGGGSSYIDLSGGTILSQYVVNDLAITLGGDAVLELAGGGVAETKQV